MLALVSANLAFADAPDPSYIDISRPFFAGANIGLPSTAFSLIPFSLQGGPNFGQRLDFRPATNLELGLSAHYSFLGGGVSFLLPQILSYQTSEGTSTFQDYRINYYGESWGFELNYSDYKGFLIENSSPYILLPNLEDLGAGFTAYYVLAPENYSLAAGMDQSKRQLRSAGSVLLTGSFRFQELTSPTPIVPASNQANFGGDGALIYSIMKTLALGGGYGYNFVFQDLFVAAVAAADLGPQLINYATPSSELSDSFLGLNVHARVSAGWNSDQLLAGLSVFLDGFTEGTQDIEILNLGLGIKVFAGFRL